MTRSRNTTRTKKDASQRSSDRQFSKLRDEVVHEIDFALTCGSVSVLGLNCYKNCKNSNIKMLMIRYFNRNKHIDSIHSGDTRWVEREKRTEFLEKMIRKIKNGKILHESRVLLSELTIEELEKVENSLISDESKEKIRDLLSPYIIKRNLKSARNIALYLQCILKKQDVKKVK